jgi:hypothetical protein
LSPKKVNLWRGIACSVRRVLTLFWFREKNPRRLKSGS